MRGCPPERLVLAIAAGVRYAAMSPAIRVVLLRTALFGVGESSVQALLPLVARDLVGGGPLAYGLLLGSPASVLWAVPSPRPGSAGVTRPNGWRGRARCSSDRVWPGPG